MLGDAITKNQKSKEIQEIKIYIRENQGRLSSGHLIRFLKQDKRKHNSTEPNTHTYTHILICPCMAYIPGKYTHASKIENIRPRGRNWGKVRERRTGNEGALETRLN